MEGDFWSFENVCNKKPANAGFFRFMVDGLKAPAPVEKKDFSYEGEVISKLMKYFRIKNTPFGVGGLFARQVFPGKQTNTR